jgi:hypothetical protein
MANLDYTYRRAQGFSPERLDALVVMESALHHHLKPQGYIVVLALELAGQMSSVGLKHLLKLLQGYELGLKEILVFVRSRPLPLPELAVLEGWVVAVP